MKNICQNENGQQVWIKKGSVEPKIGHSVCKEVAECLGWWVCFRVLVSRIWGDENLGKVEIIVLGKKWKFCHSSLTLTLVEEDKVCPSLIPPSYATFLIFKKFFSRPFLKKSRYPSPKLFFGSQNFTYQSIYQAYIQRKRPTGKIFLKPMKNICQNENGQRVLIKKGSIEPKIGRAICKQVLVAECLGWWVCFRVMLSRIWGDENLGKRGIICSWEKVEILSFIKNLV